MLDKVRQHFRDVEKRIPAWAKEAIELNKFEIINRLKAFQLEKGLDSSGRVVGTYADSTEIYAERDNVYKPKTAGMPYNFYWTGETYENIAIRSVNKSAKTYTIRTNMSKEKLLEEQFGDLFTLTAENVDYVNKNIIEPYLAEKITENLFNFNF